jgi:hypothetical protein
MWLQISIKIYHAANMMSINEMSQCFSTKNVPVDQRIRVLLQNLNPATEIVVFKIFNDTAISFELDSTKLPTGLNVIVAQAGSQVHSSPLSKSTK